MWGHYSQVNINLISVRPQINEYFVFIFNKDNDEEHGGGKGRAGHWNDCTDMEITMAELKQNSALMGPGFGGCSSKDKC